MKPFSPVQKLEFPIYPADEDRLIGWLSEHAWTAEEAILVLFGWDPHVEMRLENRLHATLADSINWRQYGDSRTLKDDFTRARMELTRFIEGRSKKPEHWLKIACQEFGYRPVWMGYLCENVQFLNQCPEGIMQLLTLCQENTPHDTAELGPSTLPRGASCEEGLQQTNQSIQQKGGIAANKGRLAKHVKGEVRRFCQTRGYSQFGADEWEEFWQHVQDEFHCPDFGFNGSTKYCPKTHREPKLKNNKKLRDYAKSAFEECKNKFCASTVQELRMQT